MKDKKRKLMAFNCHYYKEIEAKLEKFASQGLILDSINNNIWTFIKSEPQKIKYAVTFFDEASLFNPSPTDNQLNYFEIAKSSGWDFVCEYNKLQIFSSILENPIPFETDNTETLTNIHTCSKSFIYTQALLLLAFILNLSLQIDSMLRNSSRFFTNTSTMLSMLMMLLMILFTSYNVVNYFIWYYKAKKLVSIGEDIPSTRNKFKYIGEICFLGAIFCLVTTIFYDSYSTYGTTGIIFPIIHIALTFIIYNFVISILKKLNVSATTNKILSTLSIFVITILSLYLFMAFYLASNVGHMSNQRYKEIQVNSSSGNSYTARIYSDDIPLRYQDLYNIDISDAIHSYEADIDSSYLLTSKEYTHETYNLEDNIYFRYEVYTSPYNFVIGLVANEILDDLIGSAPYLNEQLTINISDSRVKSAYTMLDTYSLQYDTTGDYVLICDNTIIVVHLNDFASDEQLITIINKLLSE